MCIFGDTGGGGSTDSGPTSKGPSDQTKATRAENYRSQDARDSLGRNTKTKAGTSTQRRATTLLTSAGAADDTGKKTLLGA